MDGAEAEVPKNTSSNIANDTALQIEFRRPGRLSNAPQAAP